MKNKEQARLSEILKVQNATPFNRFKDRFENNPETGVWKLTATGCMERFNVPRGTMELTREENRTANFEYPNRESRAERRLQNGVAMYLNLGYKLRPGESLDEFVARCEGDYGA